MFVGILTLVVAVVLSAMNSGLKGIHDRNESIFNKRAILSAVEQHLGDGVKADKIAADEVISVFDSQIEQKVLNMKGTELSADDVESRGYKGGLAEHVDMAKEKKKPEGERILPMYVFNKSNGDKFYIVTVRGSGLWDEIWGNIALESDLSTIAGAAFDHKAETPGLGAEIKDNPSFKKQFIGRSIYNDEGEYTSVVVRKGGARNPKFEVDGISGATITCDGVTEMLERGIQYYSPFFDKLNKG
jgi:Na+-transporting NADH:ubiquinone oxidoreductase subunit C